MREWASSTPYFIPATDLFVTRSVHRSVVRSFFSFYFFYLFRFIVIIIYTRSPSFMSFETAFHLFGFVSHLYHLKFRFSSFICLCNASMYAYMFFFFIASLGSNQLTKNDRNVNRFSVFFFVGFFWSLVVFFLSLDLVSWLTGSSDLFICSYLYMSLSISTNLMISSAGLHFHLHFLYFETVLYSNIYGNDKKTTKTPSRECNNGNDFNTVNRFKCRMGE